MGNSNYRLIVINPAIIKKGFGLVEMTRGLVHASYSLPEWQAVKLTFFAFWVTIAECSDKVKENGTTWCVSSNRSFGMKFRIM